MKVAIVSFFHTESSFCLAKYLARQNCSVDFYFVANLLHDRKGTSGFDYPNAKRTLGNHLLAYEEAPEIYDYMERLPVRIFLSRIIHHERYPFLNKILMASNMLQVKCRNYDAINIVGQSSWIETAHTVLNGKNLIHTFHEIGNHDGELCPLRIVKKSIKDGNKVILHSKVTYDRFMSIPNADNCSVKMIPFGKFETLKLYVKGESFNLPFNDHKPILLFFGYLLPYKGLDVLAESIELLKAEWNSFNIIIAGNGNDKSLPYFQSLPNGYVINRFLNNDEMMNLIRLSSVVLLPYKTASQTGIIPTCSLYGKPFIATRVGAFPESVKDGYNGLLVEPDDAASLAAAIRKVVNDTSFRIQLADGAAHFGIDDEYSWDVIAQTTMSFLEN